MNKSQREARILERVVDGYNRHLEKTQRIDGIKSAYGLPDGAHIHNLDMDKKRLNYVYTVAYGADDFDVDKLYGELVMSLNDPKNPKESCVEFLQIIFDKELGRFVPGDYSMRTDSGSEVIISASDIDIGGFDDMYRYISDRLWKNYNCRYFSAWSVLGGLVDGLLRELRRSDCYQAYLGETNVSKGIEFCELAEIRKGGR